MKRYYALLLTRDGRVQLVRELDGRTVLADRPFAWSLGESHELALEAQDSTLRGYINGELVVEASDSSLESGAVAFVLTEGRMASQELRVQPLPG
jgi:pectate lyase